MNYAADPDSKKTQREFVIRGLHFMFSLLFCGSNVCGRGNYFLYASFKK
jgi:hypothetical protein